MEEREMRALLAAVAEGSIDPDEAALRFKTAPFTDLGYAKVDHQRGMRQGVAEVVYGAGKTPAQMAGIVASMRAAGQERVLITRLSLEAADELRALLLAAVILVYAALFQILGYFISTLLAATVILLIFRVKKIWAYPVVYAAAVAIWAGFTFLLSVRLP